MASTTELITTAIERFIGEVPALAKLKLVFRLELRGRGDVQVFRVELPGPRITRGEPDDARVELMLPRAEFNELATKGVLADWHEAYDHGHVKSGGDSAIRQLIANLVIRQEARSQLRRAR
ncbi:MAG: hypothetical protein H0W09_05890 [Solirubrobacterales bacterium]|nr:hypothetical protein [Solirubrobacterales bacterium]